MSAQWNKAHPENNRASSAKWKRENPGYEKAWNEAHPGYQKARREGHRNSALILMGRACAGCGADLLGIAWEAHHITPRAVTGRPIVQFSWTWSRIERELLTDMALLCIPCHREESQ